jgi:hypothetical protein
VYSEHRENFFERVGKSYFHIGNLHVTGPGNYLVTATVEVAIPDETGGVECRLDTPGGEAAEAHYYTSDSGTSRDTLPLQLAQRFGIGGQRVFNLACRYLSSDDSIGQVFEYSIIATRVATVTRQ